MRHPGIRHSLTSCVTITGTGGTVELRSAVVLANPTITAVSHCFCGQCFFLDNHGPAAPDRATRFGAHSNPGPVF